MAAVRADVCPIQLPGRENRIDEPLLTDIDAVVQELLTALTRELDLPYAILGYSNGALIAFELARRLRHLAIRLPVHLLEAAHAAPQIRSSEASIHDLPDSAFLKRIRELNGTPPEIFEDPELLSIILPVLRADLAMNNRYRYKVEPPLPCPITVFGGAADRDVPRHVLEPWREQTTETCQLMIFPGDHFFLQSAQRQMLDCIVARLVGPVRPLKG